MQEAAHKEALHLGIAEQGKIYALAGNHKEALRHYREAMRQAVEQKSPEVFFQHYTQCVMESLELTGAHDEVINYCQKMQDFLQGQDAANPMVKQSIASALEKEGIQWLLKEEPGNARGLLEQAQATAGKGKLPLCEQLLSWVQRGYRIDPRQIKDIQKRHQYFIVRADRVDRKRAIELPKSVSPF